MIGGDIGQGVHDFTARTKDADHGRRASGASTLRREPSFERIAADGERYVPHRFRDGLYRVADPALGPTKHHAANQIAVAAEQIGDYLRKGFLLRMRGELTGQVNLIAAVQIRPVVGPASEYGS